MATDIHRVGTIDWVMCGYFWFVNLRLKSKTYLDYVKRFSPKEYGKNDKIVLKHFHLFETKKFHLWKIF